MHKKSTVHVSLKGIWEYVSIITLILECSSIYFNLKDAIPITSNRLLILGFLPLASGALISGMAKRDTRNILAKALMAYVIYALIYILTLGRAELINFAMKFLVIFPCIYIYTLYLVGNGKLLEYIKKYINVVLVIAWISLVFWLFGSIMGVIPKTGTVRYTWGSMSKIANVYFHIYFETQKDQTFIGLWRNTAFFTEAPKYCLVLSMAYLFNEMFFKMKKARAILFVTILTTMAYTGIIGILLIYFAGYTMNVIRDIGQKKAKYRTIIWPILIAIGIIISNTLLSAKLATSSGVGRLGDFIVCFTVGIRHPLFGFGFLNNEYLNSVLSASRLASGVGSTMGLSNSISQIFIDGGIYLLMFYLYSIFKDIQMGLKRGNRTLLIFGILLLYFFITTYFAYTGMIFFLLSIGFGVGIMQKQRVNGVFSSKL